MHTLPEVSRMIDEILERLEKLEIPPEGKPLPKQKPIKKKK